ncbi:hypothetical protein KC364_g86 [Hortaea werneckii]|nr:hypothetical protein KC364_g86 [Hortaea werneckii]
MPLLFQLGFGLVDDGPLPSLDVAVDIEGLQKRQGSTFKSELLAGIFSWALRHILLVTIIRILVDYLRLALAYLVASCLLILGLTSLFDSGFAEDLDLEFAGNPEEGCGSSLHVDLGAVSCQDHLCDEGGGCCEDEGGWAEGGIVAWRLDILSRLLGLDVPDSKRDTLTLAKCLPLEALSFFGHLNSLRRDMHMVDLLCIRFDIVRSTFDVRFFAQTGIYPSGLLQLLSLGECLRTRLVFIATVVFVVHDLPYAANIDKRIIDPLSSGKSSSTLSNTVSDATPSSCLSFLACELCKHFAKLILVTSGGNGLDPGSDKPILSLRLRVSSFHKPAIEWTSFSSGGKFSRDERRSIKEWCNSRGLIEVRLMMTLFRANFARIQFNISTSVQVEITHPLQQVLQMGLVRLENLLHDRALLKQVGDSSDVGYESGVARIIWISAIRQSKGVVNGIPKCFDVSLYFFLAQTLRIRYEEWIQKHE